MSPATDTPVAGQVAGSLDQLRAESSIYDDLHVEARRVLDRNPEPRNMRDVAVALESMGYTTTGARALGFDTVFDLALAVFDVTYLYYVPRNEVVPETRPTWRRFVDDYLAGSWYGVPWIMSIVVLFVGRLALWSSLDATPQVAGIVSLAFFLAAVVAGASSQMLARRGTFYYLQKNYPLVRWVMVQFLLYGVATALLAIAVTYAVYIVPVYGLHLGEIFAEFAVAIFAFLLSAAPLYMLRRFYTLALATGLALVVTLAAAHLFGGATNGVRHAQLLGLAVGSGAMVVIAASYMALRTDVDARPDGSLVVVKPPALRVVLWHSAPYGAYGLAYFVMILIGPLVVGFAYGRSLGVDQYVYPSTFQGSVAIALLELVVLLGLVHASVERFGRRLLPLLERHTLDCWARTRATLRREWTHSVGLVVVVSAVVAWVLPGLLLQVLPSSLTASVRSPGGLLALEAAAYGFAMVPVGMLCSQYLFFLGRPAPAVLGAVGGALTTTVVTAVLVHGGDLALGAWGLLAGTTVYALISGVASYRVLAAGEESFYASF
ncbi:MAG: hypothetical protein ACLQPH_15945 [Acidimicrobiales bacterium]